MEVVKVVWKNVRLASFGQRQVRADSPSRLVAGMAAVNLGGGVGCCSSSSKSKRLTSGAGAAGLGGGGVGLEAVRVGAELRLDPARDDEACPPPPLEPPRRSLSSHSPASYSSNSPAGARESEKPPDEWPPPPPPVETEGVSASSGQLDTQPTHQLLNQRNRTQILHTSSP